MGIMYSSIVICFLPYACVSPNAKALNNKFKKLMVCHTKYGYLRKKIPIHHKLSIFIHMFDQNTTTKKVAFFSFFAFVSSTVRKSQDTTITNDDYYDYMKLFTLTFCKCRTAVCVWSLTNLEFTRIDAKKKKK